MTTSSSDRDRCTRISPSAVLDDRLDGKELEWARDHLRRCEACRERVEDFREMLLRVGRLPSAAVGADAMDEAFASSIPEQIRGQPRAQRSFDIAPPAEPAPVLPPLADLPPPVRPEVVSAPDLLSELEREIFKDEPIQDHPTPFSSMPEPIHPAAAEPADDRAAEQPVPFTSLEPEPAEEPPMTDDLVDPESMAPALPELLKPSMREVPIDSRREIPPIDAPHPPFDEEVAAYHKTVRQEPPEVMVDREALISPPEEPAATAPPRPDTAMRVAVGLGAAACVLLAAVLYEGGWLSKFATRVTSSKTAATVATASGHPSPAASHPASPSATPLPAPTSAPVLFTLGDGVAGGTVFRIRPGTAVAGYTRLVFDIRGNGLPTMTISQPDSLHVVVTFKDTTAAGVPVGGIRSYHVAGIEPAVQQGADGAITIDLARPVRVTAFTLPATAGYAWRLVVDLHTI